MYWNRELETMDRKLLAKLQLQRLQHTLAKAIQTQHYSKVLASNGQNTNEFRSLEQLPEIPFTTKDDLRKSYPDGMVAVPKKEIVRIHASSGTTGKSTVIFYTRKDIDNWADLIARSMVATGTTDEDVFQNMMGYGLFTGGLGLHYGAEKLGCLVIPAASGNSLRQLALMKDFATTVLHITPSYALHLIDVMQQNNVNLSKLHLRKAYLGAEPYSEATRQKIEKLYCIDGYNSYGLSEMNGPGVAFECVYKQGMHLWEDNYIMEIIDPDSLESVEDGQYGELVISHINRESQPILRYRTRDLTRIIPEPCPCGRTHRRIDRIKGRTDDMLILGGVNVFPSQIEAVLMDIMEIGNNYQIVLEKQGYLDKMTVRAELAADVKINETSLTGLHTMVKDRLRSLISINVGLELLTTASLPASTGKAVRVIDKRQDTI